MSLFVSLLLSITTMKARSRFLLIIVVFILAIFPFLRRVERKGAKQQTEERDFYSSLVNESPPVREGSDCRLNTCFDLSLCANISRSGLKVHIYGDGREVSRVFQSIVEIIRNSVFYEKNPKKACLFLRSDFDVLDRDVLSRDFQRLDHALREEGKNHLLFNLYSGSWPHYHELDFASDSQLFSKAILAKASQSRDKYRKDFDISLPLFSRSHPLRGPPLESETPPSFETKREISFDLKSNRNLLVFKGKRYTYGIGSETRNSLHNLHNNRDVLVITTCRHGKRWKQWKDEQCERDNTQYDKYEYRALMANSTFCLVPRGRRLASYRFLESLSLGCIPVVLANQWVLPFEEIIDWKECALEMDERLLLQIPDSLRSLNSLVLENFRHKCLAIYEKYFSSIQRIVFTTLTILQTRIQSHVSLNYFHKTLPESPSLAILTALSLTPPLRADTRTNIVVFVQRDDSLQQLNRFVKRVSSLHFVARVVVVSTYKMTSSVVSNEKVVQIIGRTRFSIPDSYLSRSECVFQLSPNSLLSDEELEFAFNIWKEFPQRLIGFVSRSHYYRQKQQLPQYSSAWTNRLSLVEMDSALYSRRFHSLLRLERSEERECADLRFQFSYSHWMRESPLKLSSRKESKSRDKSLVSFNEFQEKRICFQNLFKEFGFYLPLIESALRLDPLLFKDNVWVRRKKYVSFESL